MEQVNQINMNQIALFRSFILASIAMAVVGPSLDFFVPGLLPQQLGDAYDAYLAEEPALWLVVAVGAFSLVLLVGAVVGTVGLFLLKRWSRGFSLWLTAISTMSYPFLGPALYSGWAFMLTEVAMMLWGAVLAMAYFSELRVRFDGSNTNGAMQLPSIRKDGVSVS